MSGCFVLNAILCNSLTQILDAAKGAAAENAQGVGIWSNLGDMPHASFRALSRSSQKYAAISSPPRSITMGQDQFLPTAISLSSQGFSDSLLQSKFVVVRLEVNYKSSDASSNQEPTRQQGSQHHVMETSRVCECPPSSP